MPPVRKTKLRVLRGFDGPAEVRGEASMLTMARVVGRMTDAMTRVVKEHGLTLPHYEVLLCLKAGEGISQQDLAERLLVTKGNTCIILQKMEAAGLVERRSDPVDQRFHRLYLTDASRRLFNQIRPDQLSLHRQIVSTLNVVELNTLHDLLLRLQQSFDDIEP